MEPELWNGKTRSRKSIWSRLSPAQVLVGSFLMLVVVGTTGLMVLPGLYVREPLSLLDAVFTATSAVCVTGLIVVDTATFFTTTGQAFILLLIQLGGLGIVTFTSVIIIVLGRRLSLRHEVLASDIAEVVPRVDFRHLVRNIVVMTIVFEAAGAVVIYLLWGPSMGWDGAVWPAFFHAVSAFCNAGFSVFSNSLEDHRLQPLVQTVIMVLIVVGGVGFLTLEEFYLLRRAKAESRRFRMSLHSRLVLATSGILLIGGWVLFTAFEWTTTLDQLPTWGKLLNGLFASVTARTAGFNTIDYSAASEGANFLTILLMSIGGSPGSTAGGIKTTTFAIVGLLAWSRLRGRSATGVWSRSIPEETVQRAVGLVVIAFGFVTLAIFILAAVETGQGPHAGFLAYMFEAVSAFNTVGLSMGVTDGLSAAGRWTVIVLMFVGRVGPLSLAAALAVRRSGPIGGFRDAFEDVVVG